MREKVKDLAIVYQGNRKRIIEAIEKEEWVKPQNCPCNYVVYGDENYPKSFYRLQDAPLVLFYEGDITLFNQPCLSVVGSRVLDEYSLEVTNECLSLVAPHFVLVSGCAKGIDTLVHRAGIKHNKTIGILGCGLDVIYPKCNQDLIEEIKKNHCLVSEFPPCTLPRKFHFPWRNRLIAASSPILWVMSGKIKSGTMHTVNCAMELDSDIYGCPHPFNSEFSLAPHQSINDGALILTKENILDMIANK